MHVAALRSPSLVVVADARSSCFYCASDSYDVALWIVAAMYSISSVAVSVEMSLQPNMNTYELLCVTVRLKNPSPYIKCPSARVENVVAFNDGHVEVRVWCAHGALPAHLHASICCVVDCVFDELVDSYIYVPWKCWCHVWK